MSGIKKINSNIENCDSNAARKANLPNLLKTYIFSI